MSLTKSIHTLGMYYAHESIEEEFKEYHPRNIDKFYRYDEISPIYIHPNLTTFNKKKFNNMVVHDLEEYITSYLPKYIGNYSAANMSGKLHIGISDDGIVEGIPFFGKSLPKQFIKKIVSNCFKNYLRVKKHASIKTVDATVLDWFETNLSIEITELDIDPILFDNSYLDRLADLEKRQGHALEIWTEYRTKFRAWYQELCRYSIKLKTLINDFEMRKEIIQFIETYCLENKIVDEYQEAIEFYSSDKIIDHEISLEIIEETYNNFNSPYKWLIMFKDYMVDQFRYSKPKTPLVRPVDINYLQFAKQINNIKPYLLENKCNFFVLSFVIPKDANHTLLEYRDAIDNWFCKLRTIDKHGPKAEEIPPHWMYNSDDEEESYMIDFNF